MTTPLISIAIPTRNRPEKLEKTLNALKAQPCENVEIIVFDNSTFDTQKTKKTATAAHRFDPRVVYVPADQTLSQRASFEAALGATSGKYVSIIGDDDGFTAGSLSWIAQQIQRTPVDAVRWNTAKYVWPDLSLDGRGFIDLEASLSSGKNYIMDTAALRQKVLKAETYGSWDNILVYHGMIARNVYEKLRSMGNGCFFDYQMPDVYAHNILPLYCKSYLQIDDIITVNGLSGQSAGSAWMQASSADLPEAKRWMYETLQDVEMQGRPFQPTIRTLRYHDFVVLNLGIQRGLIQASMLDTQIWLAAINTEIARSPGQLEAFKTAKPLSHLDETVFGHVLSVFSNRRLNQIVPENLRYRFSSRVPSVRIAHVEPDLPDDITGAVTVIANLIGKSERFSDCEVEKDQASKVRQSWIALSLDAVRRRHPVLASKVINNAKLPDWVWRSLKRFQNGKSNNQLQSKLNRLHQKETQANSSSAGAK